MILERRSDQSTPVTSQTQYFLREEYMCERRRGAEWCLIDTRNGAQYNCDSSSGVRRRLFIVYRLFSESFVVWIKLVRPIYIVHWRVFNDLRGIYEWRRILHPIAYFTLSGTWFIIKSTTLRHLWSVPCWLCYRWIFLSFMKHKICSKIWK